MSEHDRRTGDQQASGIITLPQFADEGRGSLGVAECGVHVPFSIARAFYLYGLPADAVRIVAVGADGMTARLDHPLPEGARWTLFARARVASSRVINYLLPEAGARFVEKVDVVLGPTCDGYFVATGR